MWAAVRENSNEQVPTDLDRARVTRLLDEAERRALEFRRLRRWSLGA